MKNYTKTIFKQTKGRYMAQIPQNEILDSIKELTPGARNLLLYIYSLNDGWVFVEENVAKAIGTTVRQLKKYRKELVEKKYLLIQKGETDIYFIGKATVREFLNPQKKAEEKAISDPLLIRKDT